MRAVLIAGSLVLFDQLTKMLALVHLKLGDTIPILKNIVHLTLIHNSGAAFGFFKKRAALFIFISVVAILLILFYTSTLLSINAKRFGQNYRFARWGLLLVLAGTIGNLIDRIRFGYVVDFIDLRVWPVFNLADMCISLGGILLIYHLVSVKRKAQSEKLR